MNDLLVWIDCEMTGLEPTDRLVEVACVVTDSDLNVLGDGAGIDIVIGVDSNVLEGMGDFVRAMHTESGLITEIQRASTTVREAEEQVLAYIRGFVPESGKVPLCGNSIATDRVFLAREMPELDAHLHYRMVDVSSIKELARRWYPKAYFQSPKKAGGHRALADIQESIAELRYYREAVFVPPPGPSTTVAAEIAARLGGSVGQIA